MFNTTQYSLEKIQCPLCYKSFARCNAPKHKATKCHQRNVKKLMDDLSDEEKKTIKEVINKINHEDLKKLLKNY